MLFFFSRTYFCINQLIVVYCAELKHNDYILIVSSVLLFSARRQSGAAGEGVGHAEAGVRAFLRPDHREQRPRRDDRPAGGRDRARAHDTPMGAGLLGLLTAVVADSSGPHGLQRLVANEAVIVGAVVMTIVSTYASIAPSPGPPDGDANGRRAFGENAPRVINYDHHAAADRARTYDVHAHAGPTNGRTTSRRSADVSARYGERSTGVRDYRMAVCS